MKGIIFNVFNQLVEEKFGLETWEELILETQPQSEGIYTSAGTYEDKELINYVTALSQKSGIEVNDLVKKFGEYALHELIKTFPKFAEGKDLKTFLLSIHDMVHVEVRKLYCDAGLPHFSYEEPSRQEIIMTYRSPRKLCSLAEGLIRGASQHFGEKIKLSHDSCVHRGDPDCRIHVHIKKE